MMTSQQQVRRQAPQRPASLRTAVFSCITLLCLQYCQHVAAFAPAITTHSTRSLISPHTTPTFTRKSSPRFLFSLSSFFDGSFDNSSNNQKKKQTKSDISSSKNNNINDDSLEESLKDAIAHRGQNHRHAIEFGNLEPVAASSRRLARQQGEQENQQRFVPFGNELWQLRSELDEISRTLIQAMATNDRQSERSARRRLQQIERRDPELQYQLSMYAIKQLRMHKNQNKNHKNIIDEDDDIDEEIQMHQEEALQARSCLPYFQWDGLWVGKYGNHGYEMINITYVGDTLIATKVTGDQNVPRGEVTFSVDLHPLRESHSSQTKALSPIHLTAEAAQKWKTQQLPRYPGQGQVAEAGFRNNQWMDGQLIVIGTDFFSFAWLPIQQQIFFGRPSPELALKMLREHGNYSLRSTTTTSNIDSIIDSNNGTTDLTTATTTSASAFAPPTMDDAVELQKAYVLRCLEVTEQCHDDEGNGCIWEDAEECYFE